MTAAQRSDCPHCDPEHRDPTSRPWNVRVGPERDADGQPVYLYALPANGAHVAESDAEWLWQLIRDAQSSEPARTDADRPAPGDVVLPSEPTEDRLEYRLTGQPDSGYPYYDFTARETEHIEAVRAIWEKVQSGAYGWTDTKLMVRRVQVRTSNWTEVTEP